jgi:hypothetical protein
VAGAGSKKKKKKESMMYTANIAQIESQARLQQTHNIRGGYGRN